MSCDAYRIQFSELLERSLPDDVRDAVAGHVARCPQCKAEYAELERAVRALRSLPRETPPASLRAAVIDRIGAMPAAERTLPPVRARRSFVAWAAAALLLFGFLIAVLLQREAVWRTRLAGLERRVPEEELQQRLAALERASDEKLQKLLAAGQDAARGRETELERSASEAADRALAASARGEELDREVRQLEAVALRQRAEITSLQTDLTSARDDVTRLSKKIAELAAAPQRPKAAPGGQTAPAERRRTVVVRDEGGQLELSIQGPRDEVVPELLALAADASRPEAADIALAALENLLGPAPPLPAAPPAAERGWFNERVDQLATAMGMSGDGADAAADAGASTSRSRADRLAALRELWRKIRQDATEGH